MLQLTVKPGDKLVKGYHEVLDQLGQLNIDHEMAVRSAFQGLLIGYYEEFGWTPVSKCCVPESNGHAVIVDSPRPNMADAKASHA